MLVLLERVNEAQRMASKTMREMQAEDPRNKKRKGRREGGGMGDGEGDEAQDETAESLVKDAMKGQATRHGKKKIRR